jgi:ABC-type lipoprotein release transport system permease subunit
MRDIRYGFRSLRRAPAFTAAAACVLATAATFACYIPARRASRSDPMSVPRSE